MNLLITGGYGFIGSNFINHYFTQNPQSRIINIDALYYCANRENVLPEIRQNPRYSEVIGNITSLDLLRYILCTHQITHVVHFAAQSHVENSFELSLQYTQDNVLGTHTLLEACRQWGQIQRFVHVSTDEVYGESMLDADNKMHEETMLCPTNPYAATKAAAEMLVMSYYHSFKMPIIITRGNNVYGPGQYPEKLIPKFIQLLKNDQPVTIQGDGSCVRSFLYVKDVVRAFELVLESGKIGEIYNIGGDDYHEYSVMDIAQRLINVIQDTRDYEKWIVYIKNRPFNDKRYYISNEKVRALGWDIEYNLDAGLQELCGKSAVSDDTKIVVFGGKTGWIGKQLVELMQCDRFNVHATALRMEDRESVNAYLDRIKPDRVIIAAGITGRPNVDWCEEHQSETMRANVIGTLSTIDACHERGIHVTYFATGCIYEGIDEPGFTEDDEPNFFGSCYSRSKIACERVIRESYNDTVLTLRLRMPISDDLHPRSFITKITKYEHVINVQNSMSVLHDLLPVSIDMCIRKRVGIYNFCNAGTISHNEILQMYKDYIDPSFTWKNFTIEEQDRLLAAGRSNNRLNVTKLYSEYPDIPEIHVAVRSALQRGKCI